MVLLFRPGFQKSLPSGRVGKETAAQSAANNPQSADRIEPGVVCPSRRRVNAAFPDTGKTAAPFSKHWKVFSFLQRDGTLVSSA
jgi:hypothetical protein